MTQPMALKKYLGGRRDYSWSDELPLKLSKIVLDALASKKSKPPPHPEIDWSQLGRIVETYLDGREYQKGFLNKTQADRIEKVAERSGKLLKEIARLSDVGGGWYLVSKLQDAGFAGKTWRSPLEAISALSQIEPRSPRLEEKEERRLWLDEYLRVDLQAELDRWWLRHTGLSKNVPEGQDTPYAIFLKELLDRVSIEHPPGATHTTVRTVRKAIRERETAHEVRRQKIARMIEQLSRKRLK